MRNRNLFLLLAAGLVLSLTGCEKDPSGQDATPKEVNFSAKVGSAPMTKTAYTGDLVNSWERISWREGDPLYIWSDYAVDRVDGSKKFARYVVSKPIQVKKFSDNYANQSWAIIRDNEDLGLVYDDAHQDGTFKFWSIYPTDAIVGTAPTGGVGTNVVSFNIPATQEKNGDIVSTEEGTTPQQDTLKPDMKLAVMLAAAEGVDDGSKEDGVYYNPESGDTPGVAYNDDITLRFYPAFTAFEFTLKSAEETLDLSKIVLSSDSDLVGQVTATVKEGVRDNGAEGNTNVVGASTYSFANTAKSLTFNFPESTQLTTEKELVFTVFALPQDITKLSLEFYDGEGNAFSQGTLKYNGNDITFGACQKHRIRGIAVKKNWDFTYLTLDIKPLDWVPVETEISSGDGVQATQFNVVGADNLRELKDASVDSDTSMSESEKEAAKEANKAYRQWWVFPAGNTVTVTYKIMMPLVGTWAVEPFGDTDSFTVTSSTGSLSGNLAGESATATYITLTITSNATDQKSIYLKTTVTSGGETYNLDSETQLYDMRGYHYFIVNGDVDTNAL